MSGIRRIGPDEEGALLVFVGMALAVLLGMIALSFDLGRLAVTQTELQSYADSVALAAAAELDGEADAITRARSAAALVTDTQTFAEGGPSLVATDVTLTFLSALPADDTAPATATTSNPAAATFVRVDVTPRDLEMGFASVLSVLRGGSDVEAQVSATATAGFTQFACNITPMMFCLPSATYTADAHIGDMVIMRTGGSGAAWGPGDFGFLDPTNLAIDPEGPCGGSKLGGRSLYSCLTGADGPLTQCVRTRGGVTTLPGHRAGVAEAAFNVRFDIYRSTMSGEKSLAAYAPAPNVTKGVMPKGGGTCIGGNSDPTGNSISLPRDSCFASGSCPYPRFGNGTWDRTEYIRRNHNGIDPERDATKPRTRYQMYLDEIALAGGATARTPILPGRDTMVTSTNRWTVRPNGSLDVRTETGRPMCSASQSDDPARRVIVVAGVDCAAEGISGRTENVEVKEFFRIFLTEPVRDDGASPPNVDIVGEIIGRAGGPGAGSADDAGVFRDVVQLYR